MALGETSLQRNSLSCRIGYDGRGYINLTNTYRLSNQQPYAKRDYWRDERDRIRAWKKGSDASINPMENGRGDRYEYDYEGQLVKASHQALTPEATPSQAKRSDIFTYDELGNRMGSNYLASLGWVDFSRRNNKLNQYTTCLVTLPIHWSQTLSLRSVRESTSLHGPRA